MLNMGCWAKFIVLYILNLAIASQAFAVKNDFYHKVIWYKNRHILLR